MAKQYDKSTILNALKLRVAQKGFNVNVDKSKTGPGVPMVQDLLEGIAEAVSDALTKGTNTGVLRAKDFNIGPPGIQQPVATKAFVGETNVVFDMVTDPQFFIWMETFHSLLNTSYPEPGYGAPDVFAMVLKVLIAMKPKAIKGKITSGTSKFNVTI